VGTSSGIEISRFCEQLEEFCVATIGNWPAESRPVCNIM
jgi:hypothetical protein